MIDQLVDKSRLKIKVHPDHLPIMEQNIDRFLQNSTAIKELTFEADPRVRMGGCFIETPSGDIDARLESEFEIIENAILGGDQD
jgi:flagellar assembly protein FliH